MIPQGYQFSNLRLNFGASKNTIVDLVDVCPLKQVVIFSYISGNEIFCTKYYEISSIFSKKKLFLYFGKRKPWKKYFYFRKFLIFQEVIFRARNPLLRNILYLSKSNFLAPSLKNLLHFRRELAKTENQIYTIFVRWERTFQI